MDDEQTLRLPYQIRDPRQQKIYRLLSLVGVGPQSFYKDICRLRETEPLFETTTHLIGHLIREIEGSVRDVLSVFINSQDRPKEDGHLWDIQQISKGLDIPDDSPIVSLWCTHARTLAHGRAHRDNLRPPRPINEDFWAYLDAMETIFDFVLTQLEAKYLAIFDALDEKLLIQNPTRADAKWLKKNVPNIQPSYGYFFNKLENPNWLPKLNAEGFFDRPPDPIEGIEGERTYISYPPWPLSKYLVRMAALEAPEIKQQVGEILETIETTNFMVHLDIVDATCLLPIDLGSRVSAREINWLREQRFLDHLVPDKFADLTKYLADGGVVDLALSVARIALGFIEIENEELSPAENYFGREPRTRVANWDYEQFIGKTWRSLAQADWLECLRFFCSLLSEYLNRKYSDRQVTFQSYSYIWHRSIDQDQEGIPNRLVSAVRHIAELSLEDSGRLVRIIETFDSFKWDVFTRMSLYLLRLYPIEMHALIRPRLLSEDNFNDLALFHEYVALLATFFPRLSQEEQESILRWIDESGASIEEVKRRQLEWNGTSLTNEEAERSIRWAKLKWLEPLKEVLPADWRKTYDNWTAELGHPPHPGYAVGVPEVSWGNDPPVSDVLSGLGSTEEVVDFLSLSEEEFRDSSQSISRELERLVQGNVQEFALTAERFKDLAPNFVHAFISGLQSSSQTLPPDAWPGLLGLMQWVMDQGKAESDISEGDREGVTTWMQVRDVVGRFVSAALSEDDDKEAPFLVRDDLWKVLKALTDDPNPSVEYETRYGGPNMDPLTLSLNTIRGSAFHTLSKYLYWCRRHLNVAQGTGFEATPEVPEVLDRHLDPAIDSSMTVRAVYGERLPSLVATDPEWVQANLDRIFPHNNNDLWKSAWQTFIIYTRPWDNVFAVMQKQYIDAIERIGEESLYRSSESPTSHLAEHLAVFYARGLIGIQDGGLLDKFYERAPDSLAAHVFWFIARIIRDENIPDEVLGRFERLIAVRVANGQAHLKEMAAFGWIFGTGKFEPEWSLNRLIDTLKASPQSDPDHSIIEDLAKLAPSFPKLVVECMTLLVDGAKVEWKIQYWSAHLRAALKEAIAAGSVAEAEVLINKLATRGFVDFRDLLPGR